jgi:hypothetical protein
LELREERFRLHFVTHGIKLGEVKESQFVLTGQLLDPQRTPQAPELAPL